MDIKFAKEFIKSDIGFHTHFIHDSVNETHVHDFYEFAYVVSGRIRHKTNGEETVLTAGDLVFCPVGDEHGYTDPENCYTRDLLVSEELFHGVCALLPDAKEGMAALGRKVLKLDLSETDRLEELLKEYQEETNVRLKRCMAIKILVDLFSFVLYAEPSKKTETLSVVTARIVTAINKNFNRRDCLDGIKTYNYSHSYLRKIFKKEMGCTMSEYLKKIRLSHVEHYLKTTDLSLRQIAEMVGIESLSYLNRIFKEEFAVSPIRYRSKLRK